MTDTTVIPTLTPEQLEFIVGPLLINWYYQDQEGQKMTKTILDKLVPEQVLVTYLNLYWVNITDYNQV